MASRPPSAVIGRTREERRASDGKPSPSPPQRGGTKAGAVRRSQEERSSATQARLCQAALDLLVEVGYERLTTAQIALRAGVSKGAQAHHYPSKDDMLVAAYEHLLSQWEQRRDAYARQHGPGADMSELLASMWRQVFGRPDYLASLEVMLAARHNPALRDRLRLLLRNWTQVRDATFRQLVPLEDPQELATFMQISFSVLRGLALYNGLAEDKALPQRVLAMWTDIATGFVASKRRTASSRKRPASTTSPNRSSKP